MYTFSLTSVKCTQFVLICYWKRDETFRTGLNYLKSTFSPDGSYVASGSMDGGVFVWGTQSGRVEKILREHRWVESFWFV